MLRAPQSTTTVTINRNMLSVLLILTYPGWVWMNSSGMSSKQNASGELLLCFLSYVNKHVSEIRRLVHEKQLQPGGALREWPYDNVLTLSLQNLLTWFSLSTETCFCRDMFSSSSSALSCNCRSSRTLYSFISSLRWPFSASRHSHSCGTQTTVKPTVTSFMHGTCITHWEREKKLINPPKINAFIVCIITNWGITLCSKTPGCSCTKGVLIPSLAGWRTPLIYRSLRGHCSERGVLA